MIVPQRQDEEGGERVSERDQACARNTEKVFVRVCFIPMVLKPLRYFR